MTTPTIAHTEGYAWGPYLGKTSIDSETVKELLSRSNKIRGEVCAAPMLPFNFDDEWHLPPEDIKWFWSVFKEHLRSYLEGYSKHNDIPSPTDRDVNSWHFDHIWVNYYKENDMAALHNHVGDLSIVLYLQIPEYSDAIIGTAPAPGSITFTWGDSKRTFSPKVGEMFIFPSGLLHMVMPHKTIGAERISLSANLYYDEIFNR